MKKQTLKLESFLDLSLSNSSKKMITGGWGNDLTDPTDPTPTDPKGTDPKGSNGSSSSGGNDSGDPQTPPLPPTY